MEIQIGPVASGSSRRAPRGVSGFDLDAYGEQHEKAGGEIDLGWDLDVARTDQVVQPSNGSHHQQLGAGQSLVARQRMGAQPAWTAARISSWV